MSTTTTLQGLPVPETTDAPTVPAHMVALAVAVEKKAVMVFASAAARTSALAAAGVTATEGMLCWLADVNVFDYHDGAGWGPLPGTLIAEALSSTPVTTSLTTESGAVLTCSNVPLISGRKYRVRLTARLDASAAATWAVRIKCSANGPAVPLGADGSHAVAGGAGQQTYTWVEKFNATGTGNANITVTVQRTTGAGDITMQAPNNGPGMRLTVEAA